MLIALLACAGTSARLTGEASESDAAAKIVAMEHLWGQAYVNKDPKALDKILDDAFINVNSDGKTQMKADMLAEVKISTAVQILNEAMVVHLHGDTAIVTGILVVKGVNHGKPYAQQQRFVDTWFCKAGRWVAMAGLVT